MQINSVLEKRQKLDENEKHHNPEYGLGQSSLGACSSFDFDQTRKDSRVMKLWFTDSIQFYIISPFYLITFLLSAFFKKEIFAPMYKPLSLLISKV